MATIKKIIEGASVREEGSQVEITDVYYIGELNPSQNMLAQALNTSGLPRYLDYHPTRPVRCRRREVDATGGTEQVIVKIIYTNDSGTEIIDDPDAPTQMTVSAVLSQQEEVTQKENIEVDHMPGQTIGYNIVIPWTPGTSPDQSTTTEGRTSVVGSVSVLRPQVSLRYSRIETDAPDEKAGTYVGRVNGQDWPGTSTNVFNHTHTWLCTAITGTSTDGGETWACSYDFQHNDQTLPGGSVIGWRQIAFYIDPATGRPPGNMTLPTIEKPVGNGSLMCRVYDEIDFRELAL